MMTMILELMNCITASEGALRNISALLALCTRGNSSIKVFVYRGVAMKEKRSIGLLILSGLEIAVGAVCLWQLIELIIHSAEGSTGIGAVMIYPLFFGSLFLILGRGLFSLKKGC